MKSADSRLDDVQVWWLLATAAVALLPLLPHLPTWLLAATATAFGLRAWSIRTGTTPGRGLLVLAVLAGVAGVVAQYRTPFGQNPGVALLVLLIGLKQFETRFRRDGFTIILLSYFLLLASFFYSQTIAAAVVLAGGMLGATAALTVLSDSRQPPLRALKLAGLMLTQSVPLLLILFLFFPRVNGPLWGLPRDAYSSQGGLSDTMAPGSIGSLALSDAIAFRVKFAGRPPPQDKLYWRGPVLTLFDGTTWRPASFALMRTLPYDRGTGPSYAYEVTLEPHNRPWLYALELPSELPDDATAASDYQLLSSTPVIQRRRYDLQSQVNVTAGEKESPRVLRAALTLPRNNPRTQALGRAWRANYGSDGTILRAALQFFARQGFSYTLSPPQLGADQVDEFIFDTRQGFCEHFAGAFVFAMRAAGVPARVVTGYQGGEINPLDGYLEVRQSDAHAWAEVWLAGRGWLRIDPTALSFPQRIDMNLAAAVPAGDPLPFLMRPEWLWLHRLRLRWDALSNGWNQWVLGYNAQRQLDFLARLGMPSADWRTLALLLAGLSGAALIGLGAWALYRRVSVDPAQGLWLRTTRRLARRGLPRHPWEGAGDYAARVAAMHPELSAAIREIAELYGRVRYGDSDAIELLRSRVAAFRP